ncbi:MAG: hypothetical protein V4793_19660 [Paraburkholderia tropica]|uniref:hypothetical protein n=1 Tax=Paraburkholderia tropica TaxID=92647 RepID=UPI0031017395
MSIYASARGKHGEPKDSSSKSQRTGHRPMTDEEARDALENGDNEKIDRVLDELDVSTTKSGKDQTRKPDTEGSNSSSKNLDEQDE